MTTEHIITESRHFGKHPDGKPRVFSVEFVCSGCEARLESEGYNFCPWCGAELDETREERVVNG